MSQNSNRKGLALGAIFALVASALTSAPAALAASGDQLQFSLEKGTSYTSLVTEDFQMAVSLKPAFVNTGYSALKYSIKRTAGNLDIQATTSATATIGTLAASSASNDVLLATSTGTLTVSPLATTTTGLNGLILQPSTGSGVSSVTSSSAKTTVEVTAWIDSSPANNKVDDGEYFVTQTVTFVPFSDLTTSLSLTDPVVGATWITASATVAGVNLEQANGKFFFAFSSSKLASSASWSSPIDASGVPLSASKAVTALALNDSVSAQLRYLTGGGNPANIYAGTQVTAVSTKGATARGIENLTVSAAVNDNATNSNQIRVNSAVTVRAGVTTGSASVSGVAVEFTVTSSQELSLTRTLSINGVAYTVSKSVFTVTATTDASGFATFALVTSGYAANDTVTVVASARNLSDSETFTLKSPTYKVENEYDHYSTTPGSAVNIKFDVTDQWGVKSPRTDHRVKVTRGGSGFAYAETVSYIAVANGNAAFAFTPAPATKTGSATVDVALEKYDADNNSWGNSVAGTQITVNVSSTADAFSVSPAASYSASISYLAKSISWSSIADVKVKNPGAVVTIASQGLIFREAAGKASVSNTLTMRSDVNGSISFQVASLKAGTFTISLTVGGATTTSQLVVDPAASDAGTTFTIDTTVIAAGATKIVTGTLTDVNGNPVNTSGSAVIEVAYAVSSGTAGIPIGTMPTETDKDGKFTFTVFTGNSDKGFATVTATYYKSGKADTAAKDVVTKAFTVAVGGAVAEATSVTATVGTFTGYVAVFVKGAAGKKLSVKVAGKWSTVPSVVDGAKGYYLFKRNTGAGYTAKVEVYVDGSLVQSKTITTK